MQIQISLNDNPINILTPGWKLYNNAIQVFNITTTRE